MPEIAETRNCLMSQQAFCVIHAIKSCGFINIFTIYNTIQNFFTQANKLTNENFH